VLVKFKLLLALSDREYKSEVHLLSDLNSEKLIILDFIHGTWSNLNYMFSACFPLLPD
jgi:hypothetical protein